MVSIKIKRWQANQNCGGYVLDRCEWVAPFADNTFVNRLTMDSYTGAAREDLIWDLWDQGYSREEIMQVIIDKDADFLVREYPLREVDYTGDPAVELIAYRLCFPSEDEMGSTDLDLDSLDSFDYHFRIRRNGIWYEKCGKAEPRECDDWRPERWGARDDRLTYDGPIKYFVRI